MGDAGGVDGGIEYNSDLFERGSVERLAGRFAHAAATVAAVEERSDTEVWLVAVMTAAEAEDVLWRFNDTAAAYPTDVCVHELVAAQAARTPEAAALEWEGAQMTYGELQACSESVGRWLRLHGVGADSVVALQLHRSLEQVVGVIGVLMSGGAYLPLDLKWPAARRDFVAEDAGCSHLVVQEIQLAELLSRTGLEVLKLDDRQ
eukprot:4219577-Prymnesium_polylepis.1